MLAHYPHATDRYDELLSGPGPRPHWRGLLSQLAAIGPAGLNLRQQQLEATIRANGVTYNVYADPRGSSRPWALDLLPLPLPAAEWRQLEAALIQRATLLNRVLGDLYGPQQLLQDGWLPMGLTVGRPAYLRPLHGTRPPGDVFLHLYAADLARSPDGQWWVIADRTQAPSGMGYALENRIAISRLFPEAFERLHVERLAGFFRTLQQSLIEWAPVDAGETPFVVMLSPGPFNETYFEHAYLARYLGFTLVEGQDLTVRQDSVYLKTLSGLRRVHVIVRRQDDAFCDPLELRPDSALGIPGLARAQRAGKVLIANGLGSGVLETGALMGYLPGLCRQVLGEELLLPSVATWWGGEESARRQIHELFDTLVLKPVGGGDPVFCDALDAEQRQHMLDQLEADPQAWYAQELVRLAQAPSWGTQGLRPGTVGLRVFLVATPDGYVMMPGGLARTSDQAASRIVSMQRGGSSKDIWVLSEQAVNPLSLWQAALPWTELVRRRSTVSCRTAENLFWLGRYSERCDALCRALRTLLGRLPSNDPVVRRTCSVLARELFDLGVLARPELPDSGHVHLVDMDSDNHPLQLLGAIFRSGSAIRERLSQDHWRTLVELPRGSAQWQAGAPLTATLRKLDQILQRLATLAGLEMENMTRDAGWYLLRIGRRVERMYWAGWFQRPLLASPAALSAEALDLQLELADSQITYRSRTMSAPHWTGVLDLVALDPTNPRSLQFQLQALKDNLDQLPQRELLPAPVELERALQELERCLAEGGDPAGACDIAGLACSTADQLGAALNECCFSLSRDTVV